MSCPQKTQRKSLAQKHITRLQWMLDELDAIEEIYQRWEGRPVNRSMRVFKNLDAASLRAAIAHLEGTDA